MSSSSVVASSSSSNSNNSCIRLSRRRREEPVASTSSASVRMSDDGHSPETVGSPKDLELHQETEIDSQSGVSYCLSEDSNLSESSTETVHSEDLRRRLLSIPVHLKSSRNEESMEVENDCGPADSTSQTQVSI